MNTRVKALKDDPANGEQVALRALRALPGESVLVFNTDLRFVLTGGLAENGHGPERVEGRLCADVLPAERWEVSAPMYEAALRGEQSSTETDAIDGSRRFAIDVGPMRDEQQVVLGGVATARDVTEIRRVERKAAHLISMVESSHEAIVSKDLDGIVTSWNPGAAKLFGYAADEMVGRSISVLVPPGHEDKLREVLRRVRLGERIDEFETVRERKDGTLVDVALTISPMRDTDGKVVGASAISRDISARLRYQEQLRALAEQDPMTGMLNRRRFERDLGEQIARSQRYAERAAVLLIDIDGFKNVNDTHGHRAGDQALKQTAAALKRRLRDTDVVARIGGDEFALLLPYAGEGEAAAVARDLSQMISELQVALDDGTFLSISASIGTALIDSDTQSAETILTLADGAMYAEKKVPAEHRGSRKSQPVAKRP